MKYTIELASYNSHNVAIHFDDDGKATLGLYRGIEPLSTEALALVDRTVTEDEFKGAMGSLIVSMVLCLTFYEHLRNTEFNETSDVLEAMSKALHAMCIKREEAVAHLTVGPYTVLRMESITGPFSSVVAAISNFRIHKQHDTLIQIVRSLKLRGPALVDIFYVDNEAWRAEYDEKLDYNLFSKGVDLHLRRETAVSPITDEQGILEIHSTSGLMIRSDRIMNFTSRAQLENFVMEYRDKGKS